MRSVLSQDASRAGRARHRTTTSTSASQRACPGIRTRARYKDLSPARLAPSRASELKPERMSVTPAAIQIRELGGITSGSLAEPVRRVPSDIPQMRLRRFPTSISISQFSGVAALAGALCSCCGVWLAVLSEGSSITSTGSSATQGTGVACCASSDLRRHWETILAFKPCRRATSAIERFGSLASATTASRNSFVQFLDPGCRPCAVGFINLIPITLN